MYRNRRTYIAYLAAPVFILMCAAVLMLPNATLTGGKAAAQQTGPTATPTPWQNDPMGSPGNYTLFRDDNLFIAGQITYPQSAYPEPPDNCRLLDFDDFYENRSFNAKSGSSFNGFDEAANVTETATGRLANLRIVGGSGRVLWPGKEQGIIYKLSDFQGTDTGQATYSVELFDKTGNLYQHTFAPVSAGRYSHLDVAAGDLDRLRDANGEDQDEVVLASESGVGSMQLTVMNFYGGADNAWTHCADENGTCGFDGTKQVRFGAGGNYNYGSFTNSVSCSNDVFSDPAPYIGKSCDYRTAPTPQITTVDTGIPVGYFADDRANHPNNLNKGGQISVAVGDFDGDGKMEIAAVTVSNPVSNNAQLVLSLYRYTNDGKGNAQIVLNDQQNIASVYAYTDVAAGDFTGAGHDQLMVGWVGTNEPEDTASIQAYDVKTDSASGNLQSVQLSSPTTLGSSRNGVSKQCGSSVNCNPSIIQPGWVQLKAGLFKFDPNNGYGPRRRQLGVVWGNSRPMVGIAEIPTNTNTIAWLSGASPKNIDSLSGSPYCISCSSHLNEGSVPDTREAYTMVAGNFGGLNSQNPAWQLAIVAPTRVADIPSNQGLCDQGSDTGTYPVAPSIAAYQYTQGNGTSDSPYTYSLQNLSAPYSADWSWTREQYGSRGLAAVALDLDGNSMRLGAPARIVVDNLFTADAVLQEPPKHLDWVCSGTDFLNPAKCSFTNVSRIKDFNLSYTYETSGETSNEVTSTADTAVGKSSTKSAEESLEVGRPLAKVELDSEQKWESESDFKTSQENYNKNSTKQSFAYETETNQADQIYSHTRTMVVFRYPLYGASDAQDSGQQKFYDLTLPVETDVQSSPGDTSEWYKPIHENGNLLTYPRIDNFDPSPDYGFYTVGQEGQCSISTSLQCRQNSDCPGGETCTGALPGLLGNPMVNTFGSNSTSNSITYDQSGTTGAKLLTSQTLKSSEEFKYGFKATWGLPIEVVEVGGTVGGSLQYNTSKEDSWSEASVSESTTGNATGITFNTATKSTSANYQYKTWAYITQGGFLKVAQAANVIGTDVGSWYAQTYGQMPDLSLNLPRKFQADEANKSMPDKVEFNTQIERKETKSLSISDPNVPTADGAPAYISGAVVVDPNASQGQTLQLNARVYNLSTNVTIPGTDANLVARFELVPYNTNTAIEGARRTIAEVQIPKIDFYAASGCDTSNPNYPVCNSVVVSAPWNTTGLQAGEYRLYVVLDPNEQLEEYHEWKDRRNDPLLDEYGDPVDDNRVVNGVTYHLEKGQNNEGWMYVNVVAPSADTLSISTSESGQSKISLSAAASHAPESALSVTSLAAVKFRQPELSMPENALGVVESRNQLNFDHPTVHLNKPSRVRVQVNSDGDDPGYQHVLFYNQDPAKGGKPFTARLLHGVKKGANYLWVSFTPRQLGEQRHWARVVEHAADPKPGNNIASITVNVLPPDVTAPTLEVTLTPNTLRPANGRMVPVTASITVSDDQDPQPVIRLEAITHNEANDSSADVSGAEFGTDDRQFALRAERNGRFDLQERVYEVVYSATDWAGNKTYAKAYVRVPLRR